MRTTSSSGRIEVLDYLRGFFILVIIVDHLWRWPNLFQYASGRGELWVSAAEGFVIISGLLVGYIRGRKNLSKDVSYVSRKLVSRGLMLYIWSIITTVILAFLSWSLTFKSSVAYIPYSPFDWQHLLSDTISLDYAHSLTHFLYLYAVFLILAPIIVFLLRKNLWWVAAAASVALYWYGLTARIEWMQWQIIFYIPAIAGFYLDEILRFIRSLPKVLVWGCVAIAIASIVWSALLILPHPPGSYHTSYFTREPLAPARVVLSFVWFAAIGWVFSRLQPWIHRFFGWLLLPFGTNSLTAYIVHTIPLMALSFFFPSTKSFIANTLLTLGAIIVTLLIVKIPGINKVIPR